MTGIIKGFDISAIRKKRARLAASGGVDLEAAIAAISADIPKLQIGETVKLVVPKGVAVRKHVMQITAKLSNLTPKGAAWEGRQFDVVSDPDEGETGVVYVQRGPDTKTPKVRARGTGGGRPPATASAGEAKA